MNETLVTVLGNICGDVTIRDTNSGYRVTSFRLASTPRRFRNGAWEDGVTSYFTVNCWRTLAENVYASVHRGDPVVVQGVMRVRTWQRTDGTNATSVELEAQTLGFDLARGNGTFTRVRHTPAVVVETPASAEEAGGDSWAAPAVA